MTRDLCSNAYRMRRRHLARRKIEAVLTWVYRGLAVLGVGFIVALTLKVLP